ncbi:MAG TPA: hypothetical protein VFZ65_09685 [Planctomycetota bacterium]|nr:hypothetical protein [Planctomycetota bacterium]
MRARDPLSLALRRLLRAVRRGRVAEALAVAEHYWQASRDDESQGGVRCTVFIHYVFQKLARCNVAALSAMERWLDDARAALGGDARGDTMRAAEVAGLTRVLDRPQVLFAVTEQQRGTPAMDQLARHNAEMFVAAQHYALLVETGVCEPQYVRSHCESVREHFASAEPRDAETAEIERECVVDDVAVPFEALAGVGRDADALALAALVLGQHDDAEVRARLASAAARAGNPVLAWQIRDGV